MKLCTDCKHVERISGKVVSFPWCLASEREVDAVTGNKKLWSAEGSRQHGPCGMDAKLFEPMNGHSMTDDQATRQQLDALDASRYRWLADGFCSGSVDVHELTLDADEMSRADFDRAVDTAILAESKRVKEGE